MCSQLRLRVAPSLLSLIRATAGTTQDSLDASADLVEHDERSPTSATTTVGTAVSDLFVTKPKDAAHLTSSTSSLQDPDADLEAKNHDYGSPFQPALVYRTRTPWKRPTNPDAPLVSKEVVDHPIAGAQDELSLQDADYLGLIKATWTTVDVIRFAEVGKDPGPPVLWIVKPKSLCRGDAKVVAVCCKGLLKKFWFTDIEVAFRGSLFIRSTGRERLEYDAPRTSTDVADALTPTLGLPIAALATPSKELVGYTSANASSKSTRNLPYCKARRTTAGCKGDKLYPGKRFNQPRRNVLLCENMLQNILRFTEVKIESQSPSVSGWPLTRSRMPVTRRV